MAKRLPARTLHLVKFIKLLKESGQSLASVERKATLRRGTLSAWSSGVTPTDLDGIRRLARACNVSISHLLFGEEEPLGLDQIREQLKNAELFSGKFVVQLKVERAADE